MGAAPLRESAPPVLPGWEDVYAKSLDCVHCGLCLQACPTYRETGSEVSSPRGRIYLMRSTAEGDFPLADVLAEEAHLCLGCRACETACPSGVRYGAMLDQVRREVESEGLRRGFGRRLEAFALRHLIPHRRRLALAFDLLALAERTRLDRLALALLPDSLRAARALVPRVPPRRARALPPERIPARGERRGRVGFFVGCVMPQLFGAVSAATLRVLADNGFEVVIPRDQGCCGALHAHAGDAARARELVRHNARVFAAADVDALVVDSAGCGAALRNAVEWLPEEGRALADSVRDVCELLHAEGLRPPAGRVEVGVCYDDPCHLVHAQGVRAAPRALLQQIPGLRLLPHDEPDACCGAAGIYNLTHPAMSRAVLERKLRSLAAVDPDVVASGNPGCMMQLRAGLRRAGLRARVAHPIELLDESYRAAEGG